MQYSGFAITSRFRYLTVRYSRTVTLVPGSVCPIRVLLTAVTNHRHCMHCKDLNLAHSSPIQHSRPDTDAIDVGDV